MRHSASITPLNDVGADLLDALDLNDPVLARFRLEMARLVRRLRADATPAGQSRLGFWLGLPDDPPDLSRLRPPGGNSRPGGLRDSYFARRSRGELTPLVGA
jgi:hypothetical protein